MGIRPLERPVRSGSPAAQSYTRVAGLRAEAGSGTLKRADVATNPEQDFPELRRKIHVRLGEIEAEATNAGYSLAELYEHVIGMEEGRADLDTFGPWGNGQKF